MSDLQRLRFVAEADVYKAGRHAGYLRRITAGVEFSYRHGYEGEAVATTLPPDVCPVVAPAGAVPPFFAGLLPEGRRLAALRQAVKTSADDELSLLLAVGADAIGDVQVVPIGETPKEVVPSVSVSSFHEVRFADLFARSVGRDRVDRVGLPGVQEKVSARMIALPVSRRGERSILKLSPPEFPHVVENEAFFLDAARLSGVPAAEAEIVRDRDGRTGLLVRRFDRIPAADGGTGMLAQEDGCQVLGRYPADKYALTGEEVCRALVAVTRAQPVAARELLRQVAFAYLTCNGDAHAKNFSVLHDGEWRVCPAYDVPSSHPYGDHTMALSIGGLQHEDISRTTIVGFGEAIGLPPRASEKGVDDLCARSELWLGRLDQLPFGRRAVQKLRRAILYRRDRLAKPR
ncbi:MAG: HipA domain-containing protein [Acidobacteria bacterium]|nr:HipA domain-containing protein [Acidobacteriota bacterium]